MKKEMLYIDAQSGISGDMFVAAMLDLGADQKVLEKALSSLPLDGFRTVISRVRKSAIDCCDFAVLLDASVENHDHDMTYLHGHEHGGGYEHEHEHSHGHEHDETGHEHGHEHGSGLHEHEHDEYGHGHAHGHGHSHEHGHDDSGHMHRNLEDIRRILAQAEMTEGARELALRIFTILAEAEGTVHGQSPEEVHFHEVGAVDSIVDITAAAVCMDDLGVPDVIITGISEGSGTVRTQHGILPVPVPAVTAIASAHSIPLHFTGLHGEFVTPTGAAIAAAIRTGDALPPHFRICGTGIGAGKRKYELPGMLRIMRIEAGEGSDRPRGRDVIWKLETNLDDCTGEILGYVMDRLFEAGARDVHYMPVFMKKNRPAWQLNVICDEEKIPELEHIIFRETTTIGIRRCAMERTVLDRRMDEVGTPYGRVAVKKCSGAGIEKTYVEYDSAAALAKEKDVPLSEICSAAEADIRKH